MGSRHIHNSLKILVTKFDKRTLHISSALQNVAAKSSITKDTRKPFPVLSVQSEIDPKQFEKNKNAFKFYSDKFRQILELSNAGGGEKAIARHVKQHRKLLPMDRIKLLLDNEEDFLELSTIAGYKMEYGDVPKAGILTGIGKIHGKWCMIIANDGTVKGGTIFPVTLKKQLRAQEIAQQNRLPCVYAVDSGGAFLPLQSEIFNPGGQTFYNEAIMSSMGIPQVAVVCGNCTAGGAYVPTMADEAVIIHRIGTIFLGGPPLVQAATGEIVSAEDLGGATMHCSVSGCTDYYAETEQDGFQIGRDVVAGFNLPNPPGPHIDPCNPEFDPEELDGLIPCSDQHTMDVLQVIARIVDGSRFSEFKTKYGSTLVTGLAYIQGYLVGIVGNRGDITEQAAAKGAHFVQMCSERDIPLVFLQNTAPASQASHGLDGGNLLRDHAKMMTAISCSKAPKITVIIGNGLGYSNFLMCGRSCSPNFLFTWPNAVVGMMEKTQLVKRICQEKFQGKEVSNEEQEEFKKKMLEKYSLEMSAFYISSRLLDDGLILPQDTRQVIGKCLQITSAYRPRSASGYGVIRM